MCRWLDIKHYYFIQKYEQHYEYKPSAIFHLIEPDIHQEVYGVPEYISALNSAWLNESATLFRRKYFENGQHAGYEMYITDPALNPEDINNICQAVKSSRGRGNFRNLFMYAPNGKKDGIQIIPLSELPQRMNFLTSKMLPVTIC